MRSGSNKASYEIVSAFFYIIITVITAVGIVFYGQVVFLNEKATIENAQRFTDANIAKERILACYGNTQIIYDRLEEPCEFGPYLKAYTIEIMPTVGCDLEPHEKALIHDDADHLIYFIPVVHPETGYQCLGRLTVHV
jgi:hypothetical protein